MIEATARAKHGRYEPLLELASGGMATTFLARHVGAAGFERLVVLKRVHKRLLESSGIRAMLVDEARLASLIRHPNVVPVIDVVDDKGELMLVLEYVESMSLDALLSARKRAERGLPVPVVARIVSDVLAGLQAAHDATDMQGRPLELVHRDVTPHNVLVGLDGTSRLIDFGIAKASRRLTATTAGVLKGKFGYMPLEQLRQQSLDRRSDVFAAGVVLYVALTGRLPFLGEDQADLMLAMMVGEPAPPSTLVPGVPSALDAVVECALGRTRDERFQTAAAFQQALEIAAPPANAREVARLVAEHGGPRLAHLRDAVRDVLEIAGADRSAGELRTTPQPADPTTPRPATTTARLATTTPEGVVPNIPVHGRGALSFAALAAGALVVGIAITLLFAGRPPAATTEPRTIPASSSVAPPASAPVVLPADSTTGDSVDAAPREAPTELPATTPSAARPRPPRAPPKPTGELRENPYGPPSAPQP